MLNLWIGKRENLIQRLNFYLEQAEKRVLGQFDNMEQEAEAHTEEVYERLGTRFDPDHHDAGDFVEAARDQGLIFYGLLDDLRKQINLAVVAGMYHEWDKQLREWLIKELLHSWKTPKVSAEIWRQEIGSLFNLLDGWGWNLRAQPFFEKLDACRLVVNVYKHGQGKSFNDLKERYPHYLGALDEKEAVARSYVDHTQLQVSRDDLQSFYCALRSFWEYAPENTMFSDCASVPRWFSNAIPKS